MPRYRYETRIPAILDDLKARVDEVVDEAASQVEGRAKARVPVKTRRLHDSIHTERIDEETVSVIAGNTDVFYGHLVEFGGAENPIRPFMIPAVQDTRPDVPRIATDKLRDL